MKYIKRVLKEKYHDFVKTHIIIDNYKIPLFFWIFNIIFFNIWMVVLNGDLRKIPAYIGAFVCTIGLWYLIKFVCKKAYKQEEV